MAITLISSPSGEPSVQDSLFHTVSSNNSNDLDFKYVFDIFVGGVQQVRVKQFPDPTTDKGYFDAAPIVRNTFSFEWFKPTNSTDHVYLNQPSASGEISQLYQIRVGEDVSGITTTNMASGEVRAYNWVPPSFKRKTFDSTTKLNKFYTNRPSGAKIGLGQKLLIPFKTNATLTFKVDTYGFDNALIDDYIDAVTYSNNDYVQLDIGSAAINSRFSSTIINSNVKYYDVYFNSFDKFRVVLQCNPKYTPSNLYFLNRWGMFDTVTFDLVSRLTSDIERKTFTQKDYRLTDTGVTYLNADNVYHETKTNYTNKEVLSLRLTMDAPTDAEWQWLIELLTSPIVYYELEGYFYPVTLKNSNYEYSKYVNNRLRPFEVDIDINQSRDTQLR
jgi:hypothetical protein